MDEKKISEVTLRLSDTMKHDLQDIAMQKDRTLSEIIRQILTDYLYGYKHRADVACGRVDPCPTKRGD